MKIRFGTTTPDGWCRPMLFFFSGLAVLVLSIVLLQPSNECHKSSVHSQMSNLTSSIDDNTFRRLHYEKCLCSVLSNKTENSENCITDIELQCSRILPLVSFVLQICLLRAVFTLSADFNRKLIYIAWIAALFTFIGLAIGIYWSSCYQFYITVVLIWPRLPLGLLAVHDMTLATIHDEALRDEIFYTRLYRSERNRNEVKSWQELL
jgi:hypothetical protein